MFTILVGKNGFCFQGGGFGVRSWQGSRWGRTKTVFSPDIGNCYILCYGLGPYAQKGWTAFKVRLGLLKLCLVHYKKKKKTKITKTKTKTKTKKNKKKTKKNKKKTPTQKTF